MLLCRCCVLLYNVGLLSYILRYINPKVLPSYIWKQDPTLLLTVASVVIKSKRLSWQGAEEYEAEKKLVSLLGLQAHSSCGCFAVDCYSVSSTVG